ncbi:TetR/AcrR family transcriptional regulator [Sphingobium estronivorans]|uniref:TetR/AcrR family transcriptional regulator n=1 Tax=Sphingobium estronivorans TaxID=1577690 RepID=UPI00123BFBDB|nr:TetR/AcrR family transcriptional regulator [Sphingobium estronivorans]
MPRTKNNPAPVDPAASLGKRRTYNSRSMTERRSRIIAAALAIIEEGGPNSATIRSVSKRAGVALRTLYLYFDNREAMISVAIKEFFHQSLELDSSKNDPATVADVVERLDRLCDVIEKSRSYSKALSPIFFSPNVDQAIYDVLKQMALSHVFPFLDNALAATRMRPSQQLKELICTQISNTQYAVINDVFSGRLSEENFALFLKISVLSCIAGYLPKIPKDMKETLRELQAELG